MFLDSAFIREHHLFIFSVQHSVSLTSLRFYILPASCKDSINSLRNAYFIFAVFFYSPRPSWSLTQI